MHEKNSTILTRTSSSTTEKDIYNRCFDFLLTHTRTDRVIVDSRNKLTPENPRDFIVFVSGDGAQSGGWVEHRISTSRSKILNAKIPSPKDFQTSHFVYGKLSFSKNGDKITAYAPIKDEQGKLIRISTDLEVLKHTVSCSGIGYYAIYWYYDPK